jgi:hypothetical protein
MAEETFVIMLDAFLEVHPRFWPISAEANSIATLRRLSQHDGNPPLFPRSRFRMVLIENKSLIDSRTGNVNTGGIYQKLPPN